MEELAQLRRVGLINGGLIGLLYGLLLTDGSPLLMAVAFAAVGAGIGYAFTTVTARPDQTLVVRVATSAALLAVAGAVAGLVLSDGLVPALKSLPLAVWPIATAALGAFVAWVRRRDPLRPALAFAAVGWLIATFGVTNHGSGTRAEAIMALAVLGALIGGWLGREALARPRADLRPMLVAVVGLLVAGAAKVTTTYGTSESFDKLVTTVVAVVISVATFTGLWIGMNLIFNQSTKNWKKFSALIGAAVGFTVLAIIDGNRALQIIGPRESAATRFGDLVNFSDPISLIVILGAVGWFIGRAVDRYQGEFRLAPAFAVALAAIGGLYGRFYLDTLPGEAVIRFIWWPLIGAALFGGGAYALALVADPIKRLSIGAGGGVAIGLLLGGTLKTRYQPAMEIVPLIAVPVVFAGIGAAIATVRRRNPIKPALAFGLVGWIIGAFGVPTLGRGTLPEALMGFGVAGLLAGALAGSTALPDVSGRARVDVKSRAWIFMGPALLFISSTLVIPAIITTLLSVRDKDGEEFVRFRNYVDVFSDPNNFDFEDWANVFTSRLLWFGLALGALGIGLAMIQGRRTGRRTDFSPQSGGIATAGVVLLGFAVFTTLRGTIVNNVWWVFSVTLFSTGLGLAIAAWSDNARGEKLSKSLIFMPMAISFVGASIIWRFMYRPQAASRPQTGVMNAMWVWLGQKTSGNSNLGVGFFRWEFFDFNARWLFIAVFLAAGLYLFYRAIRSVEAHGEAGAAGFGLAAIVPLYLAARVFQGGIGGFVEKADGVIEAQPILFLEEIPFNNFWLMVVLLWIETGFAMVILSAAIKAVPAEFIEAAKIDGADNTQVFWRIVVPQIAPTIGVVVTTVIVRVTKVYDIVKVMSGGRSGTNVLANEMINQAFGFSNSGIGSALAILLFLSVLPVMYLNIRRMQKEALAS